MPFLLCRVSGAARIDGPARDALAAPARSGFVDAMGIVALTAAVALGGAMLVARWLPARDAKPTHATPEPAMGRGTASYREISAD